MAEEPELGIRRTPAGIHALGKVEYEISDGEVVYKPGDGRGHADRGARRSHERTHPARSQRGAHRRIRDRLRDPQSHLDLQVHRHDSAGRGLPRGTGPARRRRGARAFPGRWTGPQHRCAGCGESGLEAGPGGQRDSRRKACWIPTMPSATRSLPACCATRWRKSRSCAPTTASRRCATPCPSC